MAKRINKTRLSGQQQAFIDEYFANGFNATAAGVAAGFAKGSGCTVLNGRTVSKAIADRFDEMGCTKERTIADLAQIAHSNDIADYWPLAKGRITLEEARAGGVDTRAIKSIEPKKHGYKIELYDRLEALKAMAKIHALFVDKVDVSGSISFEQAMIKMHRERAKKPYVKPDAD